MTKKNPGSGPARKREQYSDSHCSNGSGATVSPSSNQVTSNVAPPATGAKIVADAASVKTAPKTSNPLGATTAASVKQATPAAGAKVANPPSKQLEATDAASAKQATPVTGASVTNKSSNQLEATDAASAKQATPATGASVVSKSTDKTVATAAASEKQATPATGAKVALRAQVVAPVQNLTASAAPVPKQKITVHQLPPEQVVPQVRKNSKTTQPDHQVKNNNNYSKGGKRGTKSQRRNDKKLQERISDGVDMFSATRWYLAAVKAGFKNHQALHAFNALVRTRIDDIDPMQVPVCFECGESNAELCDHFVVGVGVSADDGAIAIPAAQGFAIKWRFNWVNRVQRMFTWPRFDSENLINHYNRGFDPSIIPDQEIWPELLCYIRLNLMTEYKIDGLFNRKAKLAHCQKLAQRFFTEFKIKQQDLLEPAIVNKIKLTIARACDQRDDQTLFKECDPRRNFWVAPGSILKHLSANKLILAAAIISPMTVAFAVNASMRMKLFIFGRLVKANAEILVSGSILISRSVIQTVHELMSALARNIFSGDATYYLNQIQQSSWLAAPITFMNRSINVISRTLQSHNPSDLISRSSTALSTISHSVSVHECLARMSYMTHRLSLNQRLVGCVLAISNPIASWRLME